MSQRLPEVPKALVDALQGLVFWTGYRRTLFRNYQIPEGAFVAELCVLLQAHLSEAEALAAEVPYRELRTPRNRGDADHAERADLVVANRVTPRHSRSLVSRAKYVIEVKRAKTPWALFVRDLTRLRDCLDGGPTSRRAFLIVVGEGRAPAAFVDSGNARRVTPFVDCGAPHKVRRVVKAASSFDGHESAHYACLVEVFRESSST